MCNFSNHVSTQRVKERLENKQILNISNRKHIKRKRKTRALKANPKSLYFQNLSSQSKSVCFDHGRTTFKVF
jgi:hypothetical protein